VNGVMNVIDNNLVDKIIRLKFYSYG